MHMVLARYLDSAHSKRYNVASLASFMHCHRYIKFIRVYRIEEPVVHLMLGIAHVQYIFKELAHNSARNQPISKIF